MNAHTDCKGFAVVVYNTRRCKHKHAQLGKDTPHSGLKYKCTRRQHSQELERQPLPSAGLDPLLWEGATSAGFVQGISSAFGPAYKMQP